MINCRLLTGVKAEGVWMHIKTEKRNGNHDALKVYAYEDHSPMLYHVGVKSFDCKISFFV